jgi:hypothetical protein
MSSATEMLETTTKTVDEVGAKVDDVEKVDIVGAQMSSATEMLETTTKRVDEVGAKVDDVEKVDIVGAQMSSATEMLETTTKSVDEVGAKVQSRHRSAPPMPAELQRTLAALTQDQHEDSDDEPPAKKTKTAKGKAEPPSPAKKGKTAEGKAEASTPHSETRRRAVSVRWAEASPAERRGATALARQARLEKRKVEHANDLKDDAGERPKKGIRTKLANEDMSAEPEKKPKDNHKLVCDDILGDKLPDEVADEPLDKSSSSTGPPKSTGPAAVSGGFARNADSEVFMPWADGAVGMDAVAPSQ